MTQIPTYHLGERNFGTGLEMMRRIEKLEAENKLLTEQLNVIEEEGTESLNALTNYLTKLAQALVRVEELEGKLEKAVEVLDIAFKYNTAMHGGASPNNKIIKDCLAELKGTNT